LRDKALPSDLAEACLLTWLFGGFCDKIHCRKENDAQGAASKVFIEPPGWNCNPNATGDWIMRPALISAVLSLVVFLPVPSNAGEPSKSPDSSNMIFARHPFETAIVRQPLMFAVIIVDDDAKELAECLRFAYTNLRESLLVPVSQHGRLGGLTILSGANVTESNVRRAIRSLPVGPTDTLFVYYGGHGGINTSDGGHYLTMKSGHLSRTQVEKEIAAKRPQLGVLFTDCCSNYFPPVPGRTPTSMPVASRPANWKTIERLFFNLNGMVSVTAARPGQTALAPLFTFAFCSTLTASPAELGLGDRQNWSCALKQIPARTKLYGNWNIEQPCQTFKLGPWEK
jgi:hypothetical protein